MKFQAITIKDIAKALNLSTSTVSRALRDSYEISIETKKKVMAYAKEHNYRPNPIALGLKERRTRSIGIIVCEIANNFFSEVINGIESIAYDRGYNVSIMQSHESYEREKIILEFLASRSVDGILVSVSNETKDFSHLTSLHNRNLPIVFFDRVVNEINTHKIILDNQQAAYKATKHLLDKGYKNVATIGGSEFLFTTQERIKGYVNALLASKKNVSHSHIKYCNGGGLNYDEVEKNLNDFFKHRNKPDAIIALSDKVTYSCLHYFKKNNIKLPKQVGFIGFSNSEQTDLFEPALTVIKQPAFQMGEMATQQLIQIIESKRPVKDFETSVFDGELIIRSSC